MLNHFTTWLVTLVNDISLHELAMKNVLILTLIAAFTNTLLKSKVAIFNGFELTDVFLLTNINKDD